MTTQNHYVGRDATDVAALDKMYVCQCGSCIPDGRAEFLTETGRPLTCLSCSSERPSLVLMEYGHKTAGYAVKVPQDGESERLAWACYRRQR